MRAVGTTGSSRYRRGWLIVAVLGSVVCGAGLLAVGLPHSAESAAIPTVPSVSRSAVSPASSSQAAGTVVASTTTTTVVAPAPQLSAPPTTAACADTHGGCDGRPSRGGRLQPGPDWTWAMGDTSAQCAGRPPPPMSTWPPAAPTGRQEWSGRYRGFAVPRPRCP